MTNGPDGDAAGPARYRAFPFVFHVIFVRYVDPSQCAGSPFNFYDTEFTGRSVVGTST